MYTKNRNVNFSQMIKSDSYEISHFRPILSSLTTISYPFIRRYGKPDKILKNIIIGPKFTEIRVNRVDGWPSLLYLVIVVGNGNIFQP